MGEEQVPESICEWGLGEWPSVLRRTAPFPRVVARGSSDQRDACSKHERIGREINAAETQRLVLGFPSNEIPTVVPGLKRSSVKRGHILLFFYYSPNRHRVALPPAGCSLPPNLLNLRIVVLRSVPNLGGGDWRIGGHRLVVVVVVQVCG